MRRWKGHTRSGSFFGQRMSAQQVHEAIRRRNKERDRRVHLLAIAGDVAHAKWTPLVSDARLTAKLRTVVQVTRQMVQVELHAAAAVAHTANTERPPPTVAVAHTKRKPLSGAERSARYRARWGDVYRERHRGNVARWRARQKRTQ
jgi:hypothetical protein